MASLSRPAPFALTLLAPLLLLLVLLSPSLPAASAEDPIAAFVQETIREHPLAMFSKSYCPYCRRAKQVIG